MDPRLKAALGYIGAAVAIVVAVYYGVQTKEVLTSPKSTTINMSAEGKVSAKPDIAEVCFSVVTTGKEAAKVQEENDKKMAKVIDFLKSKGIAESDIQTANYNLYPQYNYNTGAEPAPISGYTLNQAVTAKIRDLKAVSGIMGSLTSQGVNQIDNVAYSIDDPNALKAEAREKAVESAKQKAEELAKRLGARLGKVTSYYEDPNYYPPMYSGMYDSRGMGAGGGSPVQPGEQDIFVNVTLTFELR